MSPKRTELPVEPAGTGVALGQGHTLIAEIASRARRNAAEARRRLEALPVPYWPDKRRGAPNAVIRSAVFGVVARGKRRRVVDLQVAGPSDFVVSITGWRLDQVDLDIWLELYHLARDSTPGSELRFSIYAFLRSLGRRGHLSSGDAKRVITRLRGLYETSTVLESDHFIGGAGTLIQSFAIDKTTGHAVVILNPKLRGLWESVTHLDMSERRSLGENQLAKALHATLASHASWFPMRLDTLALRVGTERIVLATLKRDVTGVLKDFEKRAWIRSFHFSGAGPGALLHINKIQSPSQVRHRVR